MALYFDIYRKEGRHWKPLKKRPTKDIKEALRVWRTVREIENVVLVCSNTDPREANQGIKMAKMVELQNG